MAWRSYLLYENIFFSELLRNLQFLKTLNNVLWRMRRYMLKMLCNCCTFSRALHWMWVFPPFSLTKHFSPFALDAHANFPAPRTGLQYFPRLAENPNELENIPCWTHHNKCENMSSKSTSDRTSKYCVNTSTTAYRAWLHVVVIHSDF